MKAVVTLASWTCAMSVLLGAPAFGADLCIEGLCVVRAQMSSTSGLMTRYQPLFLTLENRTGKPLTVVGFSAEVSEGIQILKGDEWDPVRPRPMVIRANEYLTIEASTPWRIMVFGIKQQLRVGETIFVTMKLKSGRSLTVPVRIIEPAGGS
jgi:copper(I)-binding protein